MENLNDPKYLEKMKIKLIENLRNLEGAPGVALSEVPPDTYLGSDDEDDVDPDIRISQHDRDRRIEHEAELYDSEEEEEGRKEFGHFDSEHLL